MQFCPLCCFPLSFDRGHLARCLYEVVCEEPERWEHRNFPRLVGWTLRYSLSEMIMTKSTTPSKSPRLTCKRCGVTYRGDPFTWRVCDVCFNAMEQQPDDKYLPTDAELEGFEEV